MITTWFESILSQSFETHPKFGTVRIVRHGHVDLHIIRRRPSLELRLHFHHILHPRSFMTLHRRLHPNQRLHGRAQSIAHQFELTVGGYERDGAIVLESR